MACSRWNRFFLLQRLALVAVRFVLESPRLSSCSPLNVTTVQHPQAKQGYSRVAIANPVQRIPALRNALFLVGQPVSAGEDIEENTHAHPHTHTHTHTHTQARAHFSMTVTPKPDRQDNQHTRARTRTRTRTRPPPPSALGSHAPRFEEHLLLLLKQKRRVEANVFLRRLEHYDRNPPHLAASLLGGGAAHKAIIPAWYQQLSAPPASAGSSSAAGGGGGGSGGGGRVDGDDGDGIEEVVDLTEKEVEVVECYDNEPLDCVMMRIVKQEPGWEEEKEGGRGEGGNGRGEGAAAAGAIAATAAAATAAVGAGGATGSSSTAAAPRVKMEVG